MNPINLIIINIKKLREQRGKALFLIIPVFVLMTLTIIVASQVKNFQTAIDEIVFGTLKEQATLLQIQKTNTLSSGQRNMGPGQGFQMQNFDNNFSESDLASVKALANVAAASLNNVVPISNIYSNNLFEGINYRITNLSELDSTSAALFTEENFVYEEGQPIPIILNASTFIKTYEDWQGKTELEIDFEALRNNRTAGQPPQMPGPVKTEAISYSKDELIGKEFKLKFGGLDIIQDYVLEEADGIRVFRKLTTDEIAEIEEARETAISEYWDYSKISAPQAYTFVVVGIIDDSSTNASYVPENFAKVVMKNYIKNQISAKHTDIPNDLLDKTFLGISYDGSELSSGTGFGFNRRIDGAGLGRMIVESESTDSYNIPGLVIKVSNDGENTVEGVHLDADIYASSIKSAQYMTIKVDSVYNRAQVVSKLNEMGFAYQDTNNFGVFENIQSTIKSVSAGLTITFISITAGVILFAMSKFVSESRKEIGIFRAMGMKKSTILFLFCSQAILYTLLAYATGLIAGIFLNLSLATITEAAFNNFVGGTIKESFPVAVELSSNLFATLDVQSILIYSLVLFFIAFVVSLIPAFRAASISPVEAIKGE